MLSENSHILHSALKVSQNATLTTYYYHFRSALVPILKMKFMWLKLLSLR